MVNEASDGERGGDLATDRGDGVGHMALGSLTQKSSNPQLTHFVRRVLKSDTPVYVSVETGRIAVSASGLPPCFTLKTIASPARMSAPPIKCAWVSFSPSSPALATTPTTGMRAFAGSFTPVISFYP